MNIVIIGLIWTIVGVINVMLTQFVKGATNVRANSVLEDVVRFIGSPVYILFTLSHYAHVKGQAERLRANK